MSVASASTRRRWAVVLASAAAMTAAAVSVHEAGSLVAAPDVAGQDPRAVLRQALHPTVAYSALSQTRGNLGLPDVSGLGGVAGLLGGTTRARVWWSGDTQWRVSVVTATGEQDTYGQPDSVVTWDYEGRRLVTTVGEPGARLPRADDLVAPAAARRLLAAVGDQDRLTGLGTARVAGRSAQGLRVRPADARSTIGYADVWVDRASGLPLQVRIVDRTGGTALTSGLSEVRLGRPAAGLLRPPLAVGAAHEVQTAPDLAATMDQRAPWILPDELAGLAVSRTVLEGTATYGSGLLRFAVLPLPGRVARDIIANARSAGGNPVELPGGTVWQVSSSLLDVVVAQGDDFRHAYLIAGMVSPDVLQSAAGELLADPPVRRGL